MTNNASDLVSTASTSWMERLFVALPFAGLGVLALALAQPGQAFVLVLSAFALIGAVIAAVHHAEVVAHRVGEPFGTLVLALAVTIIEVALIVSMMMTAEPAKAATLTRDTIYATVLIITGGVIGLSLLAGGLRHHVQAFQTEAARPALAILLALSVLTLVLPRFTTSAPGGQYSVPQLVFTAVVSLVLWGVFIFGQTVRHRDYFLDLDHGGEQPSAAHAPSSRDAWISLFGLLLALVAVVGLAKTLSPSIEAMVLGAGLPRAVIGLIIAMLVLAPETVAAVRADLANRLQTSLNLALGSALASIGLTIPVVVIVAIYLGLPMDLGLQGKDLVLLVLSLLVCLVTLGSRRTDFMLGAVHLVVFAAFLFLTLVP
ncbi:calcium:proton antiporter [Thiomonas bhubaneswarensis]|uniref:Ca2+/H+ antiporter n=1 Tax=Thiomonas bhubaneswarensis TaxID=339866 RepID=A0A0K6IAZ7_9BURK|nr:ionic transporter y4hA [Thiomonas bhubaneswarensis]CUB00289.1 Ca2+/H+ antiporter [Thiomonas bhubaneswarensis]